MSRCLALLSLFQEMPGPRLEQVSVRSPGFWSNLHLDHVPNVRGLVKKIAALEGGSAAVAVLYGHAAQLLAFSNILQPGDHGIRNSAANSTVWVGRSRSAASKTLRVYTAVPTRFATNLPLRVWFVLCVMFSHLFCAVHLLAFGQDVQLCIGSLPVKLTVSRC